MYPLGNANNDFGSCIYFCLFVFSVVFFLLLFFVFFFFLFFLFVYMIRSITSFR